MKIYAVVPKDEYEKWTNHRFMPPVFQFEDSLGVWGIDKVEWLTPPTEKHTKWRMRTRLFFKRADARKYAKLGGVILSCNLADEIFIAYMVQARTSQILLQLDNTGGYFDWQRER